MIRTQIYLTERQRDRLAAIARAGGRPQSAVIREAIDRFLEQDPRARREAVVRDAAGIWRDRSDVPTLTVLRDAWNRD